MNCGGLRGFWLSGAEPGGASSAPASGRWKATDGLGAAPVLKRQEELE